MQDRVEEITHDRQKRNQKEKFQSSQTSVAFVSLEFWETAYILYGKRLSRSEREWEKLIGWLGPQYTIHPHETVKKKRFPKNVVEKAFIMAKNSVNLSRHKT